MTCNPNQYTALNTTTSLMAFSLLEQHMALPGPTWREAPPVHTVCNAHLDSSLQQPRHMHTYGSHDLCPYSPFAKGLKSSMVSIRPPVEWAMGTVP
jgi:hypothetical protein